MFTVLITTSGTGSRLNNLTKFTNKSLVKVGDKYSICHIIENYPDDTEFIITLGYYGKHVQDFLEIAYPNKKFKFINIDNYDGPGSSLGYSMLQAKSALQKEFVFHCCDSIIKDKLNINTSSNIIFVNNCNDSSTYSGIHVNENNNFKICLKGDIITHSYIGISYIKDYEKFWEILEEEYNKNKNNSALSDINVLKIMNEECNIKYEIINEWYDTGNIESYRLANKQFKKNYNVLDKYDESLCFLDSGVIKFFHDKNVNLKRVERGINLYPLSPKIINYRDNFMLMEYINGDVLSEHVGYGEIYNLLIWSNTNLWTNETISENFKSTCMKFYKDKTLNRLNKLNFLSSEKNIVNGIQTGSIDSLIKLINFENLTTNTFYRFHGDFILDNIIKTDSSYKLIDWRHEFENELYLGDKYYDLAKLRHNIYFNHNNILNNLYTIKITESTAIIDMKCNFILINQLNDFQKFIKDNNLDETKIKILTAIIWLNMSPLYEGDLSLFLFYFGKFNLYLALQEQRP